MDKFAVEQVKRMQRGALIDARTKLQAMKASLTKTAAEEQEIARLERQIAELQEALAEQ